MSSEVTSRRLFAATILLALAFTSLTQTGCTQSFRRLGIVDELAIKYRDTVWAQRAFNLRFANCNREYADHFKSGFCAGYSDVSNGGDGFLPALPPVAYQGYEYQCAEGSKCVDTWFSGYPAGVAAAREEKAGNYHEMHISRMIDRAVTQSKATNVLPSDVPVNKPSATLLPPPRDNAMAKQLNDYGGQPKTYVPEKTPIQTVKAKPPVATPPMKFADTPAVKANEPAQQIVRQAPQTKLPPIVQSTVTTQPPAAKTAMLPPIVTAPKSAPVYRSDSTPAPTSAVPPIIRSQKPLASTSNRSPVIRGRKIDPVANVSSNEMPLPMAVRSNFETRSAAAWPLNRR